MQPCWKNAKDLELTAVEDGFIAYDEEKDRVHYMNHTAALVFVLCNGSSTAAEIAQLIQSQFQLETAPQDEVDQILHQFADEGLASPVEDGPLPS